MKMTWPLCSYMSHEGNVRKPVFGVSWSETNRPVQSDTEDGWKLEISDLGVQCPQNFSAPGQLSARLQVFAGQNPIL